MNEPRWFLYESASYMLGKGVALTAAQLFNPSARRSDVYCYTAPTPLALKDFEPGGFSYVALGDPLATVEPDLRLSTLARSAELLHHGGTLLLCLPTQTFTADALFDALSSTGHQWLVKQNFIKDKWLCIIAKKGSRGSTVSSIPPPDPRSVCISRLGALGDLIIATPLIASLAARYPVTLNCSKYSAPILDHNPSITNLLTQEKDIIPNPELGSYWNYWRKRYYRYINLSESLEGSLLKVEGRRNYYTPKTQRHATSNINYYNRTIELGGSLSPVNPNPLLYTNATERSAAKRSLRSYTSHTIIAILNGSSYHKAYPLLPAVMHDWLAKNPLFTLLLMGDPGANKQAWEDDRVVNLCGKTSIREAIALTEQADCVLGPETFLTNASAAFPKPWSIVFLSHSSPHNLTHYWKKCIALTPSPSLAPCYPCHQLHYTADSCPLAKIMDDSTGKVVSEGPICAMGAIEGPRLLHALDVMAKDVIAN